MSRALFLFRSGRRSRLDASGPREFLYGYSELERDGSAVAMIEEGEIGLARPWSRAFEAIAGRVARATGVHARVLAAFYRHRNVLADHDALVATTHTFGFALAALRRIGLLGSDVIVMTMGILPADPSPARLHLVRWLLAGTTLAALSKPEACWLRLKLGPGVRIIDFAFGVDLDFWRPSCVDRDDTVLSVGNDPNRDFNALVAAWRPEFPILEIITAIPIASDKPNVRILRGDWRSEAISDHALREKLQRARLVVVPLRDTLQPAGQSAALQAMACGRPVVMSANRGCWDREMLYRHEACRFVVPGDPMELGSVISALLADPKGAEAMGARARLMLEQEQVSSANMASQFRALIPGLEPA